MPTTKITDATVEPFDLADAKLHLRETLEDAANDAYITSLITTARTAAEDLMERTLLQTTWLHTAEHFDHEIRLYRGPVISIDSITYIDADGVQQTLDESAYIFDAYANPARIVPAWGTCWPATRCQPGAVAVQYKAGYGTTADSIPKPIVSWIKLALTDLYEQRSRSAERPVLPQEFARGLIETYMYQGV